jgi:hypothetical protein
MESNSMMIGSLIPTPVPEANIVNKKKVDGQGNSIDHYLTVNFGTEKQTHTPDLIKNNNDNCNSNLAFSEQITNQ